MERLISTLDNPVEEIYFKTVSEARIILRYRLSLEAWRVSCSKIVFPLSTPEILFKAKEEVSRFRYLHFTSRPFSSLGHEKIEEFTESIQKIL